PPAATISSTTTWAGPVETSPLPSRLTPMSLTTTEAPCAASIDAYARPRPLPAPVIAQMRPSQSRAIAVSLVVFGPSECDPSLSICSHESVSAPRGTNGAAHDRYED